jgi:plasmid stabilization system protein ParE
MVPETINENIREIFYGNYSIIYQLEIERIIILTVHHDKQIFTQDESS